MDDLERWLRATMHAAIQDPPRNLLTGVWRRRRTHLRRVGAGTGAALAAIAIAVPTVLASTTSGARTGPEPALAAPSGAAPGSELLKCGSYSDRAISGGELGTHWKAASIEAGPVWFVYARDGSWRSSQRLPGGRLRDVAGVILAVRNGSTAEITTAQPGRFRFVTSRNASASYTLRDGIAGITLAGCPSYQVPPDMPEAYAAGLTLFYLPLGYVTDLTGCLPVQVRTPPSWQVRSTVDVPLHGTCRG